MEGQLNDLSDHPGRAITYIIVLLKIHFIEIHSIIHAIHIMKDVSRI